MYDVASLIKEAIDAAWDTSVPVYVKIGNNHHEITSVKEVDQEVIVEVDPSPVE